MILILNLCSSLLLIVSALAMTGMMFTYGKKKEKKRTKGSQSKKHSCHSCYFHIQAYTVSSWNKIWVFTNSKKLVEYQNLSSQFGIRFKGTFLRMALVFLFFTVNVLNFIWIFFMYIKFPAVISGPATHTVSVIPHSCLSVIMSYQSQRLVLSYCRWTRFRARPHRHTLTDTHTDPKKENKTMLEEISQQLPE